MDPATDRRLSEALTQGVAQFARAVQEFADVCQEISGRSIDTSDLSDPEPKRVEIHNYPPRFDDNVDARSEPWGDVEGRRFPEDSRAGTFAGSPTHEPDSRALCRSMLLVDAVGSTHRWAIGCSRPLDHDGGHEGQIAWHRSEGL